MMLSKASSAALLLSAFLCSYSNITFAQNLVEGETYSTGDIISNDPNAWEGCYNVIGRNDFGGYSSPGGCPGVASDWVVMSYTQQTIKQTVQISEALNAALQQAGINVDGYFYHWHWKNGDVGSNQNDGADPLSVGVRIYDKNNNIVYERIWNHTFDSDPWNYVTGTETFQDPFDANDLSTFEFSVSGKDSGYWAGYYGGEVEHMIIQLRYSVRPAEGPSLEDQTVLNAQCSSDPTFSPECPGYNDAILAQMTATTAGTTQDTLGVNTGIPDTSGGISNDVATESTQSPGMDPVAETTTAPVQEVQASTSSVAETTATALEPATATTSETASQKTAGPGLNATQLSALDAANNVANAAVGIATESSVASQSSGTGSSGSDSTSGSSSNGGDTGGLSADGQDDGSSSGGSSDGSDVSMASSGGLTGQDQSLAEGGAVDTATTVDFASSDIIVASLTTDLIKDIINSISEKTLQNIKDEQKEDMEEQNAESIEEANKKEDELVQAAKEGSKDEDAQAALLGYNPSFRAYQQPQIADSEFYKDKEIYANQKTWDNPSARFFNGASDAKHEQMMRQQYER